MNKPKTYNYNILLSAPIGKKSGTMTAVVIDGKLEGLLRIMKNENYYNGQIDEKGNCEISGNIKTLMGTVEYSGTGYLNHTSIELCLNTGKIKLKISGVSESKGGGKP